MESEPKSAFPDRSASWGLNSRGAPDPQSPWKSRNIHLCELRLPWVKLDSVFSYTSRKIMPLVTYLEVQLLNMITVWKTPFCHSLNVLSICFKFKNNMSQNAENITPHSCHGRYFNKSEIFSLGLTWQLLCEKKKLRQQLGRRGESGAASRDWDSARV